MPIGEYLKIKLDELVSQALDHLRGVEKKTYTEIINDLIKERYEKIVGKTVDWELEKE